MQMKIGRLLRFAKVTTRIHSAKANVDCNAAQRLQSLHDYLEQPDVLMSIPQPHRLKISELLHGEKQTFATDPENL
jgi:hypothetical protein